MKKNKLSREVSMSVERFDSLMPRDFENGAVLDEIRESLKERESLLTPIPEDKLDEFVGKWRRKIHDEIGGHAFSLSPLILEQMLKEYRGLMDSRVENIITARYASDKGNPQMEACDLEEKE